MPYFYISFAMDKERGGFRGATVVKASSAESAISVATMRGINPGGEAAIFELPDHVMNSDDARSYINRLVGREEIMAAGGVRHGDLPKKTQAKLDALSLRVCSCCNPPKVH